MTSTRRQLALTTLATTALISLSGCSLLPNRGTPHTNRPTAHPSAPTPTRAATDELTTSDDTQTETGEAPEQDLPELLMPDLFPQLPSPDLPAPSSGDRTRYFPDYDFMNDLEHEFPELTAPTAPQGSGPQIALRFTRALQDHDDRAATRELYVLTRLVLAGHPQSFTHRVLADIRQHAHLDQAGSCTSARRVDSDSAVVTCGTHRVVVHVVDDTGVQISDTHPRGDAYRSEHTHAYTSIEL